MLKVFDAQIRRGLAAVMTLAGIRPLRWIVLSGFLMLVQTLLNTVPVIAIVPLLQLFTSSHTMPSTVRLVADVIGTTKPAVLIPVFALCIGGVYLVCGALLLLVTWWLNGRVTRLGAAASTELLRRYAAESYESHRARATAETLRNMDLTLTATGILSNVLSIVTSALTLMAICAVLLVASLLVTIVTVVLFGVAMAVTQRALRSLQREAGEQFAEAQLQQWSAMLPLIEGFKEARLSRSALHFVGKYRSARRRLARSNQIITTSGAVPSAVSQVVFAFALAGIAAILFSTGSASQTLVVLGLFAAAAMRALPTMNLLTSLVGNVRANEPNMRIIADAMEELDHSSAFTDGARSPDRYNGDIVLDSVMFRYTDAPEPVVTSIDLVIEEHSTTAIVGSSGAGKSTLIDIILGLLEPTGGTVSRGGVSIFEDRARWYRDLAVVPQDVFLLNDTLEANIAFGQQVGEHERADILRALKFAQLDSLVTTLPDGLQTIIGERGTRLSGGQRQRLGLARAIYRKPQILLLDEATSALDNETEAEIMKALNSLHGQMTIIVVAHRLSTVRDADKLVFLSDGKVESEGTFQDVYSKSASFARLVELGKLL